MVSIQVAVVEGGTEIREAIQWEEDEEGRRAKGQSANDGGL